MANNNRDYVSNQIFIGSPWRTVRPKYEKLINKLRNKSPLSFVIVGRQPSHTTEDLLGLIRTKLKQSSNAIFDVTGGNANVSLEYGIASEAEVPADLYLNVSKTVKKSQDLPIISDLAGNTRKQYRSVNGLEKLLNQFSKDHSFSIRYEKAISKMIRNYSRGKKRRSRSMGIRLVHLLDEKDRIRRSDLSQTLRADINHYTLQEIDNILRAFHKAGIVLISQGRYSEVRIGE